MKKNTKYLQELVSHYIETRIYSVRFWETKQKEFINFKDMDDNHLLNAYNLFNKHNKTKKVNLLRLEMNVRNSLRFNKEKFLELVKSIY